MLYVVPTLPLHYVHTAINIMPLLSRRCISSSSLFLAAVALVVVDSPALAFQPPRIILFQHHQHRRMLRQNKKPAAPSSLLLFSSSSSSSESGETSSSSNNSNSLVPSSSSSSSSKSFQQNLPDLSKLLDARGSIWSNIVDGELGRRGEVYTLIQVAVLFCIARGGVPVIGNIVSIVCGPGLLLLGAIVMLGSAAAMGPALSPWPVLPSRATSTALLQDGWLYGTVRHPMYAGLLAASAGFSVATGDATRLLLTALLWYVLDLKTAREEVELRTAFGAEYERYQREVPGKFVPHQWLARLPWSSQDDAKKDN